MHHPGWHTANVRVREGVGCRCLLDGLYQMPTAAETQGVLMVWGVHRAD